MAIPVNDDMFSMQSVRSTASFTRNVSIVSFVKRGLTLAWKLVCAVQLRIERQRTRYALGALTDHELKDIGLSRCDARMESARGWFD
jgi:uncharacterized protein YjiS (DUF1127 family)